MAMRAVAIEPENASYQDTLGWIYFQKGNYQKAYEHISEAIQNGGDNSATILEHMGDVYDKLGNQESARIWWQRALEQDEAREYLLERL